MNKKTSFIVLSVILFLIITSCTNSKKSITNLAEIKDQSIGAMTGTTGEQLAKKRFPNAHIKSFDDVMDAIAALKANQLDAVITGFPAAMNVCKHNSDLMMLKEPVDYENTAIAARKDEANLLKEINVIIEEMLKDGTLANMRKRWFKNDLLPYDKIDFQVPTKGELLKIGTSATREPFCFVDKDKNVTGFDGELTRRIAVKLNRPIQFVDMKFSALIPALQSGKVDLIIAGMTATAERKKKVDFSISYFQNSQVILTKKAEKAIGKDDKQAGSKLQFIDDLKTKKIGVLLGSVHDTYVLKNWPNASALQYKSPSELLLGVRSGKVEAAIYTTESLKEILRNDKELTIFGDTLFSVPIAMGFNKNNNDLREKFNDFLVKLKSDGIYDDMKNRWVSNGETSMPYIPQKKNNGTLVVGVVSDKGLPFTIVKNGKMIGFDIEMVERFASFIGKEVKLVDMEFGSLILSAATNKIDMIASTLMITEERKKQIAFSNSYMRLGASVFTLKKNIEINGTKPMQTLDDIADKNVGVYEGTVHDGFVAKKYPNAVIKRYNSSADLVLSVKTKKVDVAFLDLISAKVLLKSNNDIGILSDDALTMPLGIGFSKQNPELKKKFNSYLKRIKEDGTFNRIYERWLVNDPEKAVMPQLKEFPNRPTLKFGVSVDDLPYVAYMKEKYVGFDIELVQTFAEQEKLNLNILTVEFPALVAALSAGKVEMIADGIAITAERQKQVDFSDTYMNFRTAVIALKENLAGFNKVNEKLVKNDVWFIRLFKGVSESFYNNIIIDNRYLLIIDGLKTTAIISILSAIFGTILGGLICFMRMSKKKSLQIPAKIYISLLRGTPVLVILMIIFYVVFASVDIDPAVVAVIAFGLNFAAYVSEMYRTGIEGVDKGQTEAGIAMGFSKIKTFIYIIAPQAAFRILPVYKGELISLVKMTSIVGYIAVQDLTKASDIIRSRTFDAFFPLIMVAVLYFLISWLLLLLLGYIERITNPKSKLKRG